MNIAHLKKLGIVIFIGWCMRGKGEDMKKEENQSQQNVAEYGKHRGKNATSG